jgi:hypothetical protein
MTSVPGYLRSVSSLLTALLILLMLLPGLGWLLLDSRQAAGHPWLFNRTLIGLPSAKPPPAPAFDNLRNGTWQSAVAGYFNSAFHGREILVRGINELYFRAFRMASLPSSDTTVGVDDAIISTVYLREYYLDRAGPERPAAIVAAVRRIGELCREHGIPFTFVLTPTKVAVCPEWVPKAWKERQDSRPRSCDILRRLLSESGVRFVDAARIVSDAKAGGKFKGPAFALGGIHWTKEAALPATNAILDDLARQGLPVAPIEVESLEIVDTPQNSDGDVLNLMNLVLPWRYPSPKLSLKRRSGPTAQRLSLVFVGGSFVILPGGLMSESGQFDEVVSFNYLNLHKLLLQEETVKFLRTPAPPIDYGSEVFSADALVVELNEFFWGGGDWLIEFAKAAEDYFSSSPENGARR